MPRVKKMEDNLMLLLAQEFYASKCKGKIELLTYKNIGEYIRSNGHPDIGDHLVRHNELVKEYIKSMKENNEAAKLKTVAVFKDINIDDFLKKNRTTQSLKKALVERQNYYMEVASSASIIFEENKKLKKKVETLEKELYTMEEELESTLSSKKETLKSYHDVKRRVRILQDLVETYVYPEIANELLVQRGILKKTEQIVDPKVVEEKIVKPSDDVSKYESKLIKGLFDAL